MFGVGQVYRGVSGGAYTKGGCEARAFYKFVRHAIMLAFLIALWATPNMTLGHLLFSIATTGYIFIGIFLEERDLADAHGASFERYRSAVPMIVPRITSAGTDDAAYKTNRSGQ